MNLEGVDPVYGNPATWIKQKDGDYDDIKKGGTNALKREYKSLCYEDIRPRIQNPTPEGRELLAIEITLSHHKGADRKSKP